MKYRLTATIALLLALWQTPREPVYVFLGYVGAGIAAMGYAYSQEPSNEQ